MSDTPAEPPALVPRPSLTQRLSVTLRREPAGAVKFNIDGGEETVTVPGGSPDAVAPLPFDDEAFIASRNAFLAEVREDDDEDADSALTSPVATITSAPAPDVRVLPCSTSPSSSAPEPDAQTDAAASPCAAASPACTSPQSDAVPPPPPPPPAAPAATPTPAPAGVNIDIDIAALPSAAASPANDTDSSAVSPTATAAAADSAAPFSPASFFTNAASSNTAASSAARAAALSPTACAVAHAAAIGAPTAPSVPSIPGPPAALPPPLPTSSAASSAAPTPSCGSSAASAARAGALATVTAAEQRAVGELRVHQGATSHVVKSVHRTAHVTYDPETGRFSDVPPEWRDELAKAFGLPLALTASHAVEGYTARLPPVLLHLRESLIAHGGLATPGVFRVAPDNSAATAAKAALNACGGRFPPCDDVHIAANLLKVWFRDLPARLFAPLSETDMLACATPDAAGALLMAHFRDPHLTLLLWLLDLCADVAARASENLMTPQNLAIVFAPNVFRIADITDPTIAAKIDVMSHMLLCKKLTAFLALAIDWRAKDTTRPRP